ncbi:diguanylate cyclase, partial [Dissulfurirhabdus thermomarina]
PPAPAAPPPETGAAAGEEEAEPERPRVLVVDDSRTIRRAIERKIESALGFEVASAKTFAEARELIESGGRFFVAILDLNLPDAPDGEVVDYVLARKIPVIVLTATFSDDVRDRMQEKNILDYFVKEGDIAESIIRLVQRIHDNQGIKVLVAEDSSFMRHALRALLENLRLQVLEAADGEEALQVLADNPDVKVVITDYHMPKIDGFELVTRIRRDHPRGKLAVIGISAYGHGALSAKFLKNGADDFLVKPFLNEEFYCRVNQNIELIEKIRRIEESSIRDHLTRLYNRRYLYEAGGKLFENARRGNLTLTTALLDIDFFKEINDTLGHDAGDQALRHLAAFLEQNLRTADILARFGGEEFCILATNIQPGAAAQVFERIRRSIAETSFRVRGKNVKLRVSVGVATRLRDSLAEMITRADELLYEAKKAGRNRVVVED